MKAEEYRETYMKPHNRGAYIKEGKKDEMLSELEREFAKLLGEMLKGKRKVSQSQFEVAVSQLLEKWEEIFFDQRNKGKKMWRYFYKIYILPYKYKYVEGLSLEMLNVSGTMERFLHIPHSISIRYSTDWDAYSKTVKPKKEPIREIKEPDSIFKRLFRRNQ